MKEVPLPLVARLLGHAEPQVTMRYAHAGGREIVEPFERLGQAIGVTNFGAPNRHKICTPLKLTVSCLTLSQVSSASVDSRLSLIEGTHVNVPDWLSLLVLPGCARPGHLR